MDVLSEVLRVVQMQGAMFYHGEFSSPWSFLSPPSSNYAPYLSNGTAHIIIYHLVTEGRASARIEDGERIRLEAGDLVVFPHGDAHIVENGPASSPVDLSTELARVFSEGLKLARLGGHGEMTRFICGYFACEPHLSHVFLNGLPRVFKVKIRGSDSGKWLWYTSPCCLHHQERAPPGGATLL